MLQPSLVRCRMRRPYGGRSVNARCVAMEVFNEQIRLEIGFNIVTNKISGIGMYEVS